MTTARKVEMGPEEEGVRPGVIEGGGEIGGGTAIAPEGGTAIAPEGGTARVVERAMAEGGKGAAGEGGRKARNKREGEGEGEGRDLPVTRVASSCRPPLLTVADGERPGRRRRRSGFQISMGSGDSGEGRGGRFSSPPTVRVELKRGQNYRVSIVENSVRPKPDLLNESGFQARPDSDGVVSWGLRSEFFLKKIRKWEGGFCNAFKPGCSLRNRWAELEPTSQIALSLSLSSRRSSNCCKHSNCFCHATFTLSLSLS